GHRCRRAGRVRDGDRHGPLVRLLSAGLPAAGWAVTTEAQTPTEPPPADGGIEGVERVEHRWAGVAVVLLVLLVVVAAFAGLHQGAMPQSRVEVVDPRTLHLGGEFSESNLGSALEPDGSVTVRLIGQQYSFTPRCIVVPADTPLTFRAASADAVHGLLITG